MIEDEIKSRMTWSQQIAAWVLLSWWRENGMDLIGTIIKNVFAQKGWQTTIAGVAMLGLAAFVQTYCRGDATGGWIDPNCAYYLNGAMWLSGIAHILSPGFTAVVSKTNER